MGQIKQGILGGFSGKVGTVIGSSWNGIAYMRSIPQKIHDAKTPKQLEQRYKFQLAQEFVKKHMALFSQTYRVPGQHSPYHAAVAATLKNSLTFWNGEWWLDQSKLRISAGNLLLPLNVRKFNHGHCLVDFLWDDNTGMGNAQADDRAVIFIYDTTHDEHETIYQEITNARRSDGIFTLQLNYDKYRFHFLHFYVGFVSADGKMASPSFHICVDPMQNYADDEP